MSFLGGVIGAVGSIAGGLIGKDSQDDTNKANAAEAALNRDFQERMSNTAYRRATADMIEAGLNPMLAYSQGGASTPSGSVATYQNSGAYLGRGVANAAAGAAQMASIEQIKAQTEKAEAEADLASAQAAESRNRTPIYAENIQLTRAQVSKLEAEIPKIQAETDLSSQQMFKVMAEIDNVIKSGGLISAQTEEALSRAGLTKAQIKEVVPRIQHLLAQAGLAAQNTVNARVEQPLHEAKGAAGDALNLPKIIEKARTSATEGESFGTWLYDFLHPSDETINARRNWRPK